MRSLFIACISISLLAGACKSKAKKENPIESLADIKTFSEKVNEETAASNSKMEARKAKGDTLAMPYKDLQAYLPEISGYAKEGGPKGSQLNMPGMGSWSQAEQNYKNGDKAIKVEIVDYNGAYGAFTGVTAIYAMGFSQEDDDKKQGSADLGMKDVAAYETIYKKEQRGEIAVIAGGRFFIQLRSEGSNDPQVLHAAAKSIKLEELAAK
jgi:hypothetical protein